MGSEPLATDPKGSEKAQSWPHRESYQGPSQRIKAARAAEILLSPYRLHTWHFELQNVRFLRADIFVCFVPTGNPGPVGRVGPSG